MAIYFIPFSTTPPAPNLYTDDVALEDLIKSQGVGVALTALKKTEKINQGFGECHVRAHKVGIIAYELYGDNAFALCTEECNGACYHGTIGQYAADHGINDFSKSKLGSFCLNSPSFDQCLHGLGHGLLAWTNYEVLEALKLCDMIPAETYKQNECWRGVFMENIVGENVAREGEAAKYLSEDPAFPCTIMPEKYKNACDQFIVFRIGELYSKDFKKIAEVCMEKIPPQFFRGCFANLGTNALRHYWPDVKKAKETCEYAPAVELRDLCLNKVEIDIKNRAN